MLDQDCVFRELDLRLSIHGLATDRVEKSIIVAINNENIERLAALGIVVTSPFGEDNYVVLSADFQYSKSVIRLNGRSRNIIAFKQGDNHEINLNFEANGCSVVVLGSWLKFEARLRDSGCCLYVDEDVAIGGADIWLEGEGVAVIVGQGSLFAWNISVRTGDSHAIVDMLNGAILNHSQSIVLEKNVWVAYSVTLTKGSLIGEGSIIGAHSLVAGNVPPWSLAVGIPARVVRNNVTWTRSRNPTEIEIQRVIDAR